MDDGRRRRARGPAGSVVPGEYDMGTVNMKDGMRAQCCQLRNVRRVHGILRTLELQREGAIV